jgi:hypothetical protein
LYYAISGGYARIVSIAKAKVGFIEPMLALAVAKLPGGWRLKESSMLRGGPRAMINRQIAWLSERLPRATSGAGKAVGPHFAAIIKSFFTALTPSTFFGNPRGPLCNLAERAVP